MPSVPTDVREPEGAEHLLSALSVIFPGLDECLLFGIAHLLLLVLFAADEDQTALAVVPELQEIAFRNEAVARMVMILHQMSSD